MDYENKGWLRGGGEASRSDVHRSIGVNKNASRVRRGLAFFGPGYLVAVGYMDPCVLELWYKGCGRKAVGVLVD